MGKYPVPPSGSVDAVVRVFKSQRRELRENARPSGTAISEVVTKVRAAAVDVNVKVAAAEAAAIAAAAVDAQVKADAAETAARAAAAIDATEKADAAKGAAISDAALDAAAKADVARTAAIAAAAVDAQAKADAAKAAALLVAGDAATAATVAQAAADQALIDAAAAALAASNAVTTAAADAQTKADAAKAAAVAAAAITAQAKADAAKAAATAEAAVDAQTKANAAQAAAEAAAHAAAMLLADDAEAAAILAAQADATSKANAARVAAEAAAAADATAKANSAQAAATSAAAADATAKANAATAVANAAQSAANAAASAASAAQLTADGKNRIFVSTSAPTATAAGDQWWMLLAGRFNGVQIWSGSAWVPYQIIADSILVPGSAGTVSITDGAVTAAKVNVTDIWAANAWLNAARVGVLTAGSIEAQMLSLGAYSPLGTPTDRVPAPLTDAPYWGKVLSGAIALVTPPAAAPQRRWSSSGAGLTLTPTASQDARVYVTARLPVPSARALNVAWLANQSSVSTFQNEHVTPLPGLSSAGWGVGSHGTGNTFAVATEVAGGYSGAGCLKVTGSAANSTVATVHVGAPMVVAAGQVRTGAVWVYSPVAVNMRMGLEQWSGAGGTGTLSTVYGSTVAVAANTWTRLSLTQTIASGRVSARPFVELATGAVAAGRVFMFDSASIALGSLPADFTGASVDVGVNKFGWDGSAGSSTSTRTTLLAGARVVTWTAGGVATVSDPVWSGEVWEFPDDAVEYSVCLAWPQNGVATTFAIGHVFEAIGNAGSGQYVRITPQGFESVDSAGGSSTRLGTWDDAVLSIDRFNQFGQSVPQAQINNEGAGTFNRVYANDEFYVGGIPIVGDSESATVNGVPLKVPLLERGPRGEQFSTGLGTDATMFGELGMQINGTTAVQVLGAAKVELTPNRRYKVSLDSSLRIRWAGTPTGTSVLWLEFWIGNSAQVATAPNGTRRRWRLLDGNDAGLVFKQFPITTGAAFAAGGTQYILVRLLRVDSSTNYLLESIGTSDSSNEPILSIEDVGAAAVNPFVATTKVRTTSGTPSTPGSVKTVRFAASWSMSWGSTPSMIYSPSGDKFADGRLLHQGMDGKSKMAAVGWPILALSGKEITAARIYLRCVFTGRGAGSVVQFGMHSYGSPPSGNKPAVAYRWNEFITSGAGMWFDIDLSRFTGFAAAIADGTLRGITLGEPSGGSTETNAIFAGVPAANAMGIDDPPVFEFTYKV